MSNFPSDAGSQKQQRLIDRADTVSHWQKFEELFPTEEACVDSLLNFYAEDGLSNCHTCNSLNTEKVRGRSFRCLTCKKRSYFTSCTFFKYVRRLKAMMGAIWLLEHGVRFSACHFAELAGIAKSTASGMVKKVAMLILDTMDDITETINSSSFHRVFIRRSICTPAQEHPRMEQVLAEREYLANSPEKQLESHQRIVDGLTAHEAAVYDSLDFSPQDVDDLQAKVDLPAPTILANLSILELKGLIERGLQSTFSRNKRGVLAPESSRDNCPEDQKIYAYSVVEFVQSSMHGISRKYLQLYVSLFLCRRDRVRWGFGSIIEACRYAQPIYFSDIEAFVTPLFVKVGRLSAGATS